MNMNPSPATAPVSIDSHLSTLDGGYRTMPAETTEMPPGIPYIIGNEAAERFSYYGMRTVLVVFMTKYLLNSQGLLRPWSDDQATTFYHEFVMLAYFCPVLGAIISDAWLGKYRTIIALSLVYCLGHLALAIDHTWLGLVVGLSLIAVGAGGIKPCVSAHVGDQFGEKNRKLLANVFGWFYLSINIGAFLSTLLTPWLLERFPKWMATHASPGVLRLVGPLDQLGAHAAFGVPGILMFLATAVFWMGRHRFVHVPPRGFQSVCRSFTGEGGMALLRLLPVFVCTGAFWALADQSGSTWITQAEKLDRHWLGIEWLSAETQAINPLLVLIYIPLFDYVLYPLINRVWKLTPLRKMTIGLFLAAISFVIIALVQVHLDLVPPGTPVSKPVATAGFSLLPAWNSIAWQVIAYVVITAAEVMVWVPCLEFLYIQAPPELKSFIMSIGLLSISAGNAFTAYVSDLREKSSDPWIRKQLAGANFFWFFTVLIAVAALASIVVAATYRGKEYPPTKSAN